MANEKLKELWAWVDEWRRAEERHMNTVLGRYSVKVQGPLRKVEMTVFAMDWNGAADNALKKIAEKIVARNFKGWGPLAGPWTVLSISRDADDDCERTP
jgi:hypothetical protein